MGWAIAAWLVVTYFFVCEALWGQSLGKRLAGLRVVRRDGERPKPGAIAARNIVRVVEEPMIALISMVASGRTRRQRIGDLLAGTTVKRATNAAVAGPSRLVAVYPVIWAAGAAAFVLAVGQANGGGPTFPPAPPLGGEMSSDLREFAAEVDRACAENYNAGVAERKLIEATANAESWSERATEVVLLRSWAASQHATHDAVLVLGEPPERAALFARWRANVGERARLMDQRARAWEEGNRRAYEVAEMRIDALKIDADWMGLRFGLRVCTSNGEVAHMASNPARDAEAAHESYVYQLNWVCRQRVTHEEDLARAGRLTNARRLALSRGETLQMAGLVPPLEDFPLRRRVLRVKEHLDRHASQVVLDGHASRRDFASLNRHDAQADAQLRRLGLSACGR